MSGENIAIIAGVVLAWIVVGALAGILIGRTVTLADAKQHRGLRHEHGSCHSDPKRAGRLSVGGEISNIHEHGGRA